MELPGFSGNELSKLEAWQVVELLGKGDVSSKELLAVAFDRIADVSEAINAMPTVCPDRAYAAAEALETTNSDHPGWLGGLPIGIKDLTLVKGVRTTFGTPE